jgi:class 3 adenylate cyclase/tetratricopeptide (TPR) repeat protein
MRELPSGTVTFLFTDIEGSTRLLQDLGPEPYVEALTIHRQLLRRAAAENRGVEVEMQGDSFHFGFPTAGDGARAAAAAQDALASYAWPTKPIRVRIGLHTGEPAIADGLYAGLDVHRAARVMSTAHGGQILITGRTADLIRTELPSGLPLRDVGDHRLKDFAEPIHLYQLGSGDFPPPRNVEGTEPAVPAEAESPAEAPFLARKTVTVLASEVSRSTTLGESLDPETTRRTMSRYFDEMRVALERHGGTVEKFVGDAVKAVFGIPELHEDDALRAVRAAEEMRQRIADLNDEYEQAFDVRLEVRVGVNTGEVVAGDASRGEAFPTGDAVNVAARLEQAAEPGEILIGGETRRLVRDAVQVAAVEPLELKGKSKPVPAWRLLAVTRHAPGIARRLDSPIVGRERELGVLEDAFYQAERERACRTVTVLGSPGSGKSRLAAELLHSQESDAVSLQGTCLPYGEGITFWPVAEMLRAAASITEADPPDEVVRKLAALLQEGDERTIAAERLGSLLGVGNDPASLQELFWAVRRLFESLASERPLIAVFDDLHWAEPSLLDLIEYILSWSSGSPILLVCLARQELLEDRPSFGVPKPNAVSVLLEPLVEDETHELIENLLGRAGLEPALEAQVATAAEGNPLFVEELLRMLIDDGALVRDNGHWVAAGDLSGLAIPPTINALLAARLDRLGVPERGTLQRASVIGRTFWWGAVSRLSPEQDRPRVPGDLQTLVRKELISPDSPSLAGEDAFRFGHILLRDAAYRGLPKQARAELHERFAGWLEEKAGERAAEYEEILGYHLEQGYRLNAELAPPDDRVKHLGVQAADRLRSAGRRAQLRGDVSSAANLLGRAAELVEDPSVRMHVLLELAEAKVAVGDFRGTTKALDEAGRAAVSPVEAMQVEVDRLYYQSLVDPEIDLDDLTRTGSEAIAVFEPAGDDEGLAKAWRLIAEAHLTTCRWGESAAALERALEHAARADLQRDRLVILTHLANAYFWGSTPVDVATQRCNEILESARGHLNVEANVLCYLAGLLAMKGEFHEARASMNRGFGLFEELGNRYALATHTTIAGQIELLAGEAERAVEVFRSGFESFEEMGETGVLSTVAGFLAEALLELDRDEEAARFVATAEETASDDDAASQILSRVVRARLLARSDDRAGAERLLEDAAARAEETDFLDLQGKVWVALADVASGPVAAEAAQKALVAYETKGNAAAAARVRVILPPR